MNYQRLFLSGIFLSLFMLSASAKTFIIGNDSTTVRTSDTDYADELEKIRMHMPDIEVGNGISFQPKNKSYKLTMRIRMQNLVDVDFNEKLEAQDIDARVKRLRLRFDGYIYTPKLTYLVQLGFSPYDMKTLPNGNNNIVRDAMIYYVPNSTWNIGFGQTKIRANRARINSSSALQFVDRSIVNSEFNLDRDFGIFGEYNQHLFGSLDLAAMEAAKAGEGTKKEIAQAAEDKGSLGAEEIKAMAEEKKHRKTKEEETRKASASDTDTTEEEKENARKLRSEERRVGKECRSRWSPYH